MTQNQVRYIKKQVAKANRTLKEFSKAAHDCRGTTVIV